MALLIFIKSSIQRLLWCLIAAILALIAQSGAVNAQEIANPNNIAIRYGARIIETHSLEVAYSDAAKVPASGWQPTSVNSLRNYNDIRPFKDKPPTIWLRFRFSRDLLAPGQLAFMMDLSRRNMAFYLNGIDVYNSQSIQNDQAQKWNSPIFVQLPNRYLNPGLNEITMRIDTTYSLGWNGGLVNIGPYEAMRKLNEYRHLVDKLLPQIITSVMVSLSVGLLFLWLGRRKDFEFFWLALCGFVFSALNFHIFVSAPLFNPWLFENIASLMNYLFLIAILGFTGYFIKLSNFKVFITLMSAVLIILMLLHFAWMYFYGDNYDFYKVLLLISVGAIIYFIKDSRKALNIERIFGIAALVSSVAFSIHDYGFLTLYWRGINIFLQPYSAVFLFWAFAFALGNRVVKAFNNLENMNEILDANIKTATDKLLESEASRRKLEVSLALEAERERLMREIHDGIGSSLMTTLAVTKAQDHDSLAVPALQRAIADLRIAVDSLEPIKGNITTLIASLRHRLEPDLNEAGIKFIWRVDDVAPIAWIDASHSLHILRILQEAIGNIVAHAKAQNIVVVCKEGQMEDIDGVFVEIQDDGVGFAPNFTMGRGISNMKTRAASIGANLSVLSNEDGGVTVSLWVPKNRI